jgi:RimJ/RimL family protein N-acetyltransferase
VSLGLLSRAAAEGNGVTTPRLSLRPVGPEHLPDLVRLKADERVFGWMLHGTRTPERTAEELEDDAEFWLVRGYGTWSVFERETGAFLGIAGLMERPDGRGVALRFALWPECRGRGYARERRAPRSPSGTGAASSASSPWRGRATRRPAPC